MAYEKTVEGIDGDGLNVEHGGQYVTVRFPDGQAGTCDYPIYTPEQARRLAKKIKKAAKKAEAYRDTGAHVA